MVRVWTFGVSDHLKHQVPYVVSAVVCTDGGAAGARALAQLAEADGGGLVSAVRGAQRVRAVRALGVGHQIEAVAALRARIAARAVAQRRQRRRRREEGRHRRRRRPRAVGAPVHIVAQQPAGSAGAHRVHTIVRIVVGVANTAALAQLSDAHIARLTRLKAVAHAVRPRALARRQQLEAVAAAGAGGTRAGLAHGRHLACLWERVAARTPRAARAQQQEWARREVVLQALATAPRRRAGAASPLVT